MVVMMMGVRVMMPMMMMVVMTINQIQNHLKKFNSNPTAIRTYKARCENTKYEKLNEELRNLHLCHVYDIYLFKQYNNVAFLALDYK